MNDVTRQVGGALGVGLTAAALVALAAAARTGARPRPAVAAEPTAP